MNQSVIHFVDPTIPGLSGRDLAGRAAHAIDPGVAGRGGVLASMRRGFAIRRALADLDRHQLRDLGIDRGAS